MEYSLKEHGDYLEQTYCTFIQTNFSTYERVWTLYIGNKGNDTKADIVNYPADREEKRQKFSEHTYTVLQSLISLNRLIEKDIFSKDPQNSNESLLDLQDNLILFFTQLGRIRDNVQDASKCLINVSEPEITSLLDEFYHKRHLVVHGKMIPIILKSSGDVFLPILSRSTVDQAGWYHKSNSWDDVKNFKNDTIENTVSKLFWELLPILVEIFGRFKKSIEMELIKGNYKLKFENRIVQGVSRYGSGSFNAGGDTVNVYGIPNFGSNPKK